MSKVHGGVKNPRTAVTNRRKGALVRLEAQLKAGTKPEKNTHSLTRATLGAQQYPLTDTDRRRMEREIETLKSRIKTEFK